MWWPFRRPEPELPPDELDVDNLIALIDEDAVIVHAVAYRYSIHGIPGSPTLELTSEGLHQMVPDGRVFWLRPDSVSEVWVACARYLERRQAEATAVHPSATQTSNALADLLAETYRRKLEELDRRPTCEH